MRYRGNRRFGISGGKKADKVIGTGKYRGRSYLILFMGNTKFGHRAKLAFTDGSKVFWAEASEVSAVTYHSPRPFVPAPGGARDPQAAPVSSGKSMRQEGNCPNCGRVTYMDEWSGSCVGCGSVRAPMVGGLDAILAANEALARQRAADESGKTAYAEAEREAELAAYYAEMAEEDEYMARTEGEAAPVATAPVATAPVVKPAPPKPDPCGRCVCPTCDGSWSIYTSRGCPWCAMGVE